MVFFMMKKQVYQSEHAMESETEEQKKIKDDLQLINEVMEVNFDRLLAPCLLQNILELDNNDEASKVTGFNYHTNLPLEKPKIEQKLYRATKSEYLNTEIMYSDGSDITSWENIKGKKIKFKKFLSHTVEDPTKKLTYLTKDELTQKWHGPPSQCGWVAKNENFWDDEKNQLVHDVGLVVTLVQETKAREIHDFND